MLITNFRADPVTHHGISSGNKLVTTDLKDRVSVNILENLFIIGNGCLFSKFCIVVGH